MAEAYRRLPKLTRRDFLKVLTFSGAGLAAGCGPSQTEPIQKPTEVPTAVQKPAVPTAPPAVATSVTKSGEAVIVCNIKSVDMTTPQEKQRAEQEFAARYPGWTREFVKGEGAGGNLRVVVPEAKNHTFSEGVGYGMTFAAVANDKTTFDRLFAYAKSHSKPNGLTSWDIDENNKVSDQTATTDGEEDIAFALVLGEIKWGGYKQEAINRINSIMSSQVESGTFVLKPADNWGGSNTTNPSYFSPAYYKIFAAFTGDKNWLKVADKCYEIIDTINAKNPSGQTGLLPNWAAADGKPSPIRKEENNFDYAWDAARVPLRLLMDALWFCDQRAVDQLTKINNFVMRLGPENIKAGFKLDGQVIGDKPYAVFLAPLTAASIIVKDQNYREKMWNLLKNLPDTPNYYYDPAIRLFSLLVMGDLSKKPV